MTTISPVLERLMQALDRVVAELRELVEEQHPVVRKGSVMYLETPLGPPSRPREMQVSWDRIGWSYPLS